LLNNHKRVVNILTQSMVISLFAQNLNQFPSIRYITVRRMIPLLSPNLVCCKENDLAVDAFQKIVDNNIRGLAVLNDGGILVDNISIRDLRAIGTSAESWYRLWSTVKDLKQAVRKEFTSQTPNKVITVAPEDRFEDIIKRMDDGNIHRVYVAELNSSGELIPTHVITQRDILRFVLHRIGLATTTIEQATY